MASGIKANFGTDCKPLHVGHAARVRRGGRARSPRPASPAIPARSSTATGSAPPTAAGSPPAWDLATAGLGAPHEVVDPGIGVKRFPACASTHQALDATLALAEEHAIDPAAVEAVECAVHYLAPHQLIYDRAETGAPGQVLDAVLRVGGAARSVGRASPQFTDERVRRADVQALMPKVRMFIHPEQTTRECLPTRFSEVTITLRDGRRLQRRVRQAKGQPRIR